MKDPEQEKLLLLKEQIGENIATLQANLVHCIDNLGMIDTESTIYNTTLDLQEDLGFIDNLEELEEIIEKAKDIEKAIDFFLAKEGFNTLCLSWPLLSS